MVGEENIEFLNAGGRPYIVGTPKYQFKRFERQLLSQERRTVREGLEVQLCACPDGGEEAFVLCRSRERQRKEQAMHERFERRIDDGRARIPRHARDRHSREARSNTASAGCLVRTRAAGRFAICIRADKRGAAQTAWTKVERWRTWPCPGS